MANVRSGTRGQELPNVSASNGAQAAAPGHMPATNAQAGQTGEKPDARDAERVRTNTPITSYTGSAYTTVGGPYFHPTTHSSPLLSRQNMSRALREVEPAFATADAAHIDYNNVRHVYPHLTIGKIYDDLEWQKDAGFMDQKTYNLITGVCGCSAEIWHEPSNVHEWRSGLRYNAWDGASGEWKLAEEWMRIFALRPDYLELAPPDVQDAFEAMQQPRRKKKHSTTQVSLRAWVTKRLADLDLEMTSTWEAANVALDLHVAQLAVGAAGTHHNFDSEPAAETLTNINPRKRSRDDWDVDKDSSVCSSPQKRVARPGQINAPQPTGYALIPQLQTFYPTSALANCYPTQLHVLLAQVAVPQMPAPPVHIPLNLTPPPATVLTPQPIRSGRLSGLRPSNGSGPWEYEWSTGRKRIFLEATHIGQVLPPQATPQHDNFFSSYCTSEHVDLRHLGHLDITITEILTFFPDHLKWRAVAQRLRIAGWTAGKARQFIFWCRQIPMASIEALKRPTMQQQLSAATRTNSAGVGWSMANISWVRGVARNEHFGQLSDYFLVDLAEGVVQFPQGADRGLLSVAVDHALRHNHNQVKLSDLHGYIQREQLVLRYGVSANQSGTAQAADVAALARHMQRNGPVEMFWRMGGYYHN